MILDESSIQTDWASGWCVRCGPHFWFESSRICICALFGLTCPRLGASFFVEFNIFMTICSRFDCEITKLQFVVFICPSCSHVCGNKPPQGLLKCKGICCPAHQRTTCILCRLIQVHQQHLACFPCPHFSVLFQCIT